MRKATESALQALIEQNTIIIDPNARTIKEMTEQSGRSACTISRAVQDLVAKGKVEKVHKRVNGKLVVAFRDVR